LLTSTFLKLLRQIFGGGGATGGGGGGGFLSGVVGFFSNFIGSLFGGFGFGGGGGGGSFFGFGGDPTGLPGFGRAMGGPVFAGTPYFVGERGPELFVPQTSGRVVSNRDMAKAGPIINISLNVTGVRNPQEFVASADQVSTKLAEAVERSLRLR
jgi:hypothetical protein